VAERAELWPTVTRMTCSDVMRVRCGDSGCRWRQQAGAHGGSMLSRKRSCRTSHPRLARSITGVTKLLTGRRRVARKPPYLATDRRPGAPPAAMKGLRGESLFTGAKRLVRKQVEAKRDPTPKSVLPRGSRDRVCEDSRVRECDLMMCCVASPPRCPSDRHRLQGATGASPWSYQRVRATPSGAARRKGRRHPGSA
jgi:hypothetical protein